MSDETDELTFKYELCEVEKHALNTKIQELEAFKKEALEIINKLRGRLADCDEICWYGGHSGNCKETSKVDEVAAALLFRHKVEK